MPQILNKINVLRLGKTLLQKVNCIYWASSRIEGYSTGGTNVIAFVSGFYLFRDLLKITGYILGQSLTVKVTLPLKIFFTQLIVVSPLY